MSATSNKWFVLLIFLLAVLDVDARVTYKKRGKREIGVGTSWQTSGTVLAEGESTHFKGLNGLAGTKTSSSGNVSGAAGLSETIGDTSINASVDVSSKGRQSENIGILSSQEGTAKGSEDVEARLTAGASVSQSGETSLQNKNKAIASGSESADLQSEVSSKAATGNVLMSQLGGSAVAKAETFDPCNPESVVPGPSSTTAKNSRKLKSRRRHNPDAFFPLAQRKKPTEQKPKD